MVFFFPGYNPPKGNPDRAVWISPPRGLPRGEKSNPGQKAHFFAEWSKTIRISYTFSPILPFLAFWPRMGFFFLGTTPPKGNPDRAVWISPPRGPPRKEKSH